MKVLNILAAGAMLVASAATPAFSQAPTTLASVQAACATSSTACAAAVRSYLQQAGVTTVTSPEVQQVLDVAAEAGVEVADISDDIAEQITENEAAAAAGAS